MPAQVLVQAPKLELLRVPYWQALCKEPEQVQTLPQALHLDEGLLAGSRAQSRLPQRRAEGPTAPVAQRLAQAPPLAQVLVLD